ncbi:MAG TPA: MG2 domain-containing protein [Nitrosopumilaceae archaeon]|nr:MG2 domain-containing protein [Nitrosopumilaceae archaeon]
MKLFSNFLKLHDSPNLFSNITILLVLGFFFFNFGFISAFADNEQTGQFKSSYSKLSIDSENPFTMQTQKHLYKPGDGIKIEGSIWSGLITELGGVNLVTVQVLDSKDSVVGNTKAQVTIDGQYSTEFTLPASAENGTYTINAKIEVSDSVLSSLTLKTQGSLQSSTKFVVANSNTFSIKSEGKNFDVTIASNSQVSNLQFNEQAKNLTFIVSGETGTKGVTDIIIPKSLLSGDMNVMIDGHMISQNDVIETADTQDGTTLEINYNHSTHTIEVTGTNAVPEFPTSIMTMFVAISMFVIFVSSRRHILKLP